VQAFKNGSHFSIRQASNRTTTIAAATDAIGGMIIGTKQIRRHGVAFELKRAVDASTTRTAYIISMVVSLALFLLCLCLCRCTTALTCRIHR
jgi:hypothetical protein